MQMVNLTIDNINVSVSQGTTILDAAVKAGIKIPTLCYLKEINEIGACRVCVVEIEGKDRLVTSCNNYVEEGMVVYTNSEKVRASRKNTVELILSKHRDNCASCVRSGNCTLQALSNELNITDVPYEKDYEKSTWDKSFPIIRDASKCIGCMRCVNVCEKIQGLSIWDVEGIGSRTAIGVSGNKMIRATDCATCGQCITHCPVGALSERDDTEKVWAAIHNPEKTVIVQVAPAVRTAWGESLGLSTKEATMGKMVDALRKLGFDHVFDTVFTADLTIMEEGNEFLKRFTSGELSKMPMFTSCCPGWVRFVKAKYPHLVKQLSTAKSPQQMFGAVMKTWYAEKIGKKPEDIVTVSIMPCTAKKSECEMDLFYEEYAGHDVDIVLTTRELARMIRSSYIDPHALTESQCDALMKDGTGAGVIFGATGGVMEAALRSAYFILTGQNPDTDAFKSVRSNMYEKDWKEAEFAINDIKVRCAVVNGLKNTAKLLDALEKGEVHYDFVEVMACPGGCVGGGGQPIHDGEECSKSRGDVLYKLDRECPTRFSHENPDVKALYEDFFGEPNSHKAHMLLHTEHGKNNFRTSCE